MSRVATKSGTLTARPYRLADLLAVTKAARPMKSVGGGAGGAPDAAASVFNDTPASSFPIVPVAIGVGVLAAGAVAFFVLRKKGKRKR
jgi:uncharacterized membrane protein